MKRFFVLGFVFCLVATANVREITISVEKRGEVTHWSPDRVEVFPGEKIKFIVKHDLEGGYDFHGFFVPQLKIQKQINRYKTEEITVSIPKSMKAGEYPMGCHFHPKHVAATLVVTVPQKESKK